MVLIKTNKIQLFIHSKIIGSQCTRNILYIVVPENSVTEHAYMLPKQKKQSSGVRLGHELVYNEGMQGYASRNYVVGTTVDGRNKERFQNGDVMTE